jgi:NADPH:quinone reductase-like Zn-dependent oxidoreductase
MRAARIHRYGPPDELVVEEAPTPVAGPGEVLIAVVATAVNPIDWKMRAGVQAAAIKRRMPTILGMDVSGIVEAVGPGVTRFKPGNAVFSSPDHRREGTYAEYVVVPAEQVAIKPTSITHAEAASIPLVGLTAWDCLVRSARLKSGEKVLIHAGSGGVGTFAIQLAKHLGAEVSTTCSARNEELVRSVGADHVVDYRTQRFDEVLPPQDVILEAMSGEVMTRSLAMLRRGARVASINSGMGPRTKRWGPFLGLVATILATAWMILFQRAVRGVRVSMVVRRADGETLARIAALVDEGVIRPIVDRILPLEEIADAHRYGETGRARGKIVIQVRPEPSSGSVHR